MITENQFIDVLKRFGYEYFTGVPCSSLTAVYGAIGSDPGIQYVPAPNEGSAYSLAMGLTLGGGKPAVLIQNSGFGNLVNPLTSLSMPYRLPVLTFMTLRGWPSVTPEEPQHEVMGRCSQSLLSTLGVPGHLLEPEVADLESAMAGAEEARLGGQPFFVLIPPGTVLAATAPPPPRELAPLTRSDAIAFVLDALPDALFVTATGYISRDTFRLGDRAEIFYLQGAMGHTISVAAGVALARPARRVVALDGDGGILMHLGALSMVGALGPGNLVHVVLNNGSYESTGQQPTTAATTALPEAALACGYSAAATLKDANDLGYAKELFSGPGPILLDVRIANTGSPPGSRATSAIRPDELVRRFSAAAARIPGELAPGKTPVAETPHMGERS